MPLWLHGLFAFIAITMSVQIYRALKFGRIFAALSEIEEETSPTYFAVLKYGHMIGVAALLLLWAAFSIVFGISR